MSPFSFPNIICLLFMYVVLGRERERKSCFLKNLVETMPCDLRRIYNINKCVFGILVPRESRLFLLRQPSPIIEVVNSWSILSTRSTDEINNQWEKEKKIARTTALKRKRNNNNNNPKLKRVGKRIFFSSSSSSFRSSSFVRS